jgi:hypothetical protein
MTSNSPPPDTSLLPGDIDTHGSNTVRNSFGLDSPLTPSNDFDSDSHHTHSAPPSSGTPQSHNELHLSPNSTSRMDAGENVAGPSKEANRAEEENFKENAEVRVSSQDFPPSPPLTRSNSLEDSGAAVELDITERPSGEDWHPLKTEVSSRGSLTRTSNSESDPEGTRLPPAEVQDGEGDSVVDSSGRVLILENGPEGRPRRGSHLHIEVKQASPQPWDLVEPPSSHTEKTRNPYGTTSSNKFSTLQNSAYVRKSFW